MPEERITFERITQIYREEKRKRSLVPLPQNFFHMLREYIAELQNKCEEEEKQSVHSPKSIMLRDELKKALKKRDEIWKMRMRKLVTSASSKLMGASIDTAPLTKEEVGIYETIVKILEEGSQEIYGLGKREEKRDEEKKEETKTPKEVEEKAEETKESRETLKDEFVVHILEDLPPLAGKDENYHLKKNDIVTLPKEIASVLCKKKKAKRIEVTV